ncbi:MAG TPA: hypothetical protein VNQ73_01270 [Ilumatobacter sp.]|nr:hypothetical protein [Ilumatobacter sp.]
MLAGVGLVAVVGIAVGAWLVGSRVQSSEQAAARAAPPVASLVTAPVEWRVLSSTVITRADVASATSVAVSGPTLDAQGGAGSGIVTGVFVGRGDEVAAGVRVVEVAGRPVFVFAGSTPAFRPLRPGMAGADVAQLQAGLVAVGCEAGESGVYDEATKACVERFYADAGYSVVRSSVTEVADLAAAASAVADAEDALAVSELSAAAAGRPPSGGGVTAAQSAVADAQRVHDAAVRDRPGLIEHATRQADDAVASASWALHAATVTRDALAASPEASSGEIAAAQAAVNDAQRAYDTAVADHPRLVTEATRQADDAIAAAASALTTAKAMLAEATAAPDSSVEALMVEQQRRAVDRTRQALADLEAVSGPVVPFGEMVFVPELPARVDAVGAVVGQPAGGDGFGAGSGPLVVLASPVLEAHVSIPQANAGLVQEQMPVELLYEATGETVQGVVRSIGDELETSPTSGLPAYLAVIDAELPERWSGLNLRATFTSATTKAEVLVVPSAAVSSAVDGQTRVQVERPDRTVETVPVTTGLSADGFVEVTPITPDALAAGDQVVIGR